MDDHKQHFLLRAALASEGRALTLYEEVHTLATKEKYVTHQQFLDQLKSVLPADCCPILVTDAGFRTTWFKLVASMGWDWVGRVRNRHYLRWISGGRWFDAKRCYQWASTTPKYLGEGVLTQRNQINCQLVIYKAKPKGRKHVNRFGMPAENHYSRKKAAGQREPWLLATSLPASSKLPKQVVRIYRKRMQIEESFRDLKSHRFGLSLVYHRTAVVARLQVLLLIAHLALIVIWLLGQATILKQKHYQFQANSIKHKRVLSVIFIGLQMIQNTRIDLARQDIKLAWEKLYDLQQ